MPLADGLLLAIDQGTSSTKALLVDAQGDVVSSSAVPVSQSHPQPGWVEQNPNQIWDSVRQAVRECVDPDRAGQVVGLGLSVQRESVVLWDTASGEAIGPVVSWQDQRTVDAADRLEREGHAPRILATTGLPLDSMFSALKIAWLLDRYDPLRAHTKSGHWKVGTIDAWLLSKFDDVSFGGDVMTELGNASRTQLLAIDTGGWDAGLLELFGVPRAALPRVVSSVGPFPAVRGLDPLRDGTPVLAVLADSHSALFAHAGWRPGVVKATYGTGSSVMALGGRADPVSGLCSTIAWQVDEIAYALEANVRSTGRTMTWLADLFEVDVDQLWQEAGTSTSDGVVVVPAFGGLGAPWWDGSATPVIAGLSLGSGRPQLAVAVLESIAFQVDDVLSAFRLALGTLQVLTCDGGLTRSRSLMQRQADVSGITVQVAATASSSGLGAAHLAGIGAGSWSSSDLEHRLEQRELSGATSIVPDLNREQRESLRAAWATAIARARTP